MFLKCLRIYNCDNIIREIIFRKGVNFIIDETIDSHQQTGNNVGKTTILRLVDYCFGGDGKNIYKDTEFSNQTNTTVEKFLKDNNIIVEIVLLENLDDEDSRKVVIKRNFQTRKNRIQEINGEAISVKDFDNRLKQYIFNTEIEKPTFRQIVSKNIRDDKNKMSNILKVLNHWAKSEEYEALYFFWLGIEFSNLGEKQLLIEKKRSEERIQRVLSKTADLPFIEQALVITKDKIEKLDYQKSTFNINEDYSDDLDRLNKCKSQLNILISDLGALELRRELIVESKNDLEKDISKVDVSQIQRLYDKASSLISNIQVSFEETLQFHNKLIKEKVKYITKDLPELQSSIAEINSNIKRLIFEEKNLTNKLKKNGVVEDLELIFNELNLLYERKGKFEQQRLMWQESNERLSLIENDLNAIDNDIESKDALINSRISQFNKYFTVVVDKLYNESYLLSHHRNNKGYELSISNIDGNPSVGKKKGQISAFDFAYIQFADSLGIKCLHFIMHDQLENIHDNQLNIVFDLANSINCQYIVPILRDKIPSNVDIDSYEIVSLSQYEKLFRI